MKQIAPLIVSAVLLLLLPACGREESLPSGPDTTPPLPPVGLAVVYSSDGEVGMSWRANREGDLAGYRIYRAEEPQPDTFQLIDETDVALYVDKGLEYEITYYYAVNAFDQSGNESKRSNVVSAQPINVSPPRQPRNVQVQAHNRDDGVFISLMWDANTDGDLLGYYVYRSFEPQFKTGVQSLFDSTFVPRYRDTVGVEVGTSIYYRITAFDRGHLQSLPTPPEENPAEGDRPLARPVLESPPDGSTTPAFPTFRWQPVPDASEYSIFVSTSSFTNEIWSFTLSDTVVIYNGRFLTSGVTYYWRVGTITNTLWDPNSLSAVWSFRPE